jgi:hypothetical protein
MNRIPPAARTLVNEIKALDPDITSTTTGVADGYRLHRSIRFTKSEWLGDALEVLEDERIAEVTKENAASTLVIFVGDVRADQAHPFHVDVVYEVLTGDQGDAEPEEQEGQEDGNQDDADDDASEPQK